MIWLRKSELIQLATTYLLANTPQSLFNGMLECEAVKKMRYDVELEDLVHYYDKITSRADRTEIVMALAYGVLLGILLHKDNLGSHISPETGRLRWGEKMRSIATSVNVPASIVELSGPKAQVQNTVQPGSKLFLPAGTAKPGWENGQ